MDDRDTPQKCHVCRLATTRQISGFGIAGEHTIKQMYEHEQDKWALATGEKHRTAGDLSDWAERNGKAILQPGETLKKQDHMPDEREVEKALDKIHSENHGLGEIR